MTLSSEDTDDHNCHDDLMMSSYDKMLSVIKSYSVFKCYHKRDLEQKLSGDKVV